jgi:hypothetical protein
VAQKRVSLKQLHPHSTRLSLLRNQKNGGKTIGCTGQKFKLAARALDQKREKNDGIARERKTCVDNMQVDGDKLRVEVTKQTCRVTGAERCVSGVLLECGT